MPFTEKFNESAWPGDAITCEVDGFVVTATIHHDACLDTPWEREDGHGPVSEWTGRPKEPGERVLCEDRGCRRYYNVQEATEIAKRDGWDAKPFGEGTPGERAARAVEADFQALRAWCNDEWTYCGIVLSVSRAGVVLATHAASLWGIDLNYPGSDNSYLNEVAGELLDGALEEGKRLMEALCKSEA